MKKHEVFYKKRLMRNSTTVLSILVAVAFVISSGVSAIDITNDSLTNENKNVVNPTISPTGLAPKSVSAERMAMGTGQVTNDNDYAPVALGEYMYTYAAAYGPSGEGTYKYDIETPGEFELLGTETTTNFLAGGTYTCDYKWLAVEYANGALFEVDTETGEITEIGGGGVGLNGLALDPTSNLMYGCSSTNLVLVDQESGGQEVIGPFGIGDTMIGMAFDADGVLYGWDVKFSGDTNLYTIDTDEGTATVVGPMGKTLCYAQDGDFIRAEDRLILTAYIYSPEYGGYCCEVDKETGELEIIGAHDNNCEADGSMIMNGCIPPEDDVGVKEIVEPQDGYAVDPINPVVLVKNYGNNSEITDVQFEVIKCEAGPLILEEHFDTWPPAGWNYYGYEQSASNHATGTPPEAYYGYYSGHYYSNGYLETPQMNASGYEKINVKFKCLGEFSTYYTPYFYLHYRKNATSSWRDVSPWENPISGDLGPDQYEIGCYGWGEDLGNEFQSRWYFGSYYYYLLYGSGIYIDDVIVEGCAGCAEYAELEEDVEVEYDTEVEVEFPDWTPSEWHNESYQDTWEEYPLTAYTLLEDDNQGNNKKQRLLSLYYPWLHDVGAIGVGGPETGPAQTFPIQATIKNVGQYEECCFKVHVSISGIDFGSADELLNVDYFYPFPPSGWTRTNTKWSYSYSSYAGGSPYEARFYWSPSETGMFRLYTPPIDTSGYGAINIQFKHYVNNYNSDYTLRVETSQDAISWTSVWDIPGGSYGPETIEIMTGENVGDETIVSWTYDGNSFNINYWYVDDVVISGIPVTEPEYEDEVCVEDIQPGEEILYDFDDWTPAYFETGDSGTITYNIKAETNMEDPMDNNLANDAFQKTIELDFFHDVEITGMTSPVVGAKGDAWYAYNAYDPSGQLVEGPCTFESDNPGYIELLAPTSSGNFLAGADWVDGEWIGCQYDTGALYKIDPGTGDMEYIGGGGSGLNGLAYDDTSGTLYGAASYNLYEVDPETGSQTLVGSWGSSYLAIAIAIADGVCYMHDIVTDSIYLVDLDTGSATLLGSTGQASNYAQDMAYDRQNDQMFISGYTSTGTLYEMDMENGHFTSIGAFQGGAEMTGFAIPGQGTFGIDVYVTPGNQNIEALLTNLGTYEALDMTCYAEIFEFITNCTNGTSVYTDMITGIDIEEPLGGTAELSFADYNFAEEGGYGILLTLENDPDDDEGNNVFQWGVGVDDTAPNSGHSVDPATPDGENGYYVSDVTVTVSAMDPSIGCEAPGSGVKEIRYTIDGDAGVIPGATGTFDITTDGNDVEIEYWAIDNVGNTESKNSFTIDMDQTVPEIDEVLWEAEQENPLGSWIITFTCNAEDETAGMDRVEMYINDGLWATIEDAGPEYVFEMEWSSAFENVMFTFIHYDRAGWSTEDELFGGDIQSYAQDMDVQVTQQQITPI